MAPGFALVVAGNRPRSLKIAVPVSRVRPSDVMRVSQGGAYTADRSHECLLGKAVDDLVYTSEDIIKVCVPLRCI